VLVLLGVLPRHVQVLPVHFHTVTAIAILVPMAAVALARAKMAWLRIEQAVLLVVLAADIVISIDTLAHIIAVIIFHRPGSSGVPLLSASVGIWVTNVLLFSLLYWQVDRGGPPARASASGARPDWVFPQPARPEDRPPGWRPLFVDYLFLAYCTATSFGPCDTLPLTRRAKLMMMIESMISLLTTVVVASRAIGVLR
jgi:hypothetical protein